MSQLFKSKKIKTKTHSQFIWYNPEFVAQDTGLSTWFDVESWQRQNAIIGKSEGRGTTWFINYASFQIALRHYLRGGLFGKLNKQKYLFTRWKNTRSFQEFTLLLHLKQSGVPVPSPVAARAVKNGLFYTADILTEKVANAQDLLTKLKTQELSDTAYENIGKAIRLMHDCGVNHTDLNIKNILIDELDNAWIIDFDKCYIEKKTGWWQAQNLSRLLRSFKKEGKKHTINWQKKDWDKLSQSYYQ